MLTLKGLLFSLLEAERTYGKISRVLWRTLNLNFPLEAKPFRIGFDNVYLISPDHDKTIVSVDVFFDKIVEAYTELGDVPVVWQDLYRDDYYTAMTTVVDECGLPCFVIMMSARRVESDGEGNLVFTPTLTTT